MIELPGDKRELLDFVNMIIEQCRVSVGMRAAYYRLMNAIAETGRYDGTKSMINMLHDLLRRTADHIFNPIELKFSLDFGHPQPEDTLGRAQEVGKTLTREWERKNTDMRFGDGVFEAGKYGACFLKQWPEMRSSGKNEHIEITDKLVMPWQLGVFREDEVELDRQDAVCETTTLTMPEVWQRIWHFPDAKKLMSKVQTHAQQGKVGANPDSFFHQVLSTSQINTGVQGMTRPLPGGIVQLNNDPNYSIMGPVIAAPTVDMHELWIKGRDDYQTIQLIEPDILITRFKLTNLLGIPEQHPYRLIQPNPTSNWLWGRSLLVDLIEPQMWLSSQVEDAKRLLGVQVDKVMGFVGEAGITDETYAQFRAAGYANFAPNVKIEDLTPKFPPEVLPMVKFTIDIIHMLAGFTDLLQGKGESGVRAGVHAETLLKTGSPVLRKMSLRTERQCSSAADLTLHLMQAKDPSFYWTKADQPITDIEKTKFLLSDLPDDWRVIVDSHSSSPIFADETAQLILQAAKLGYVDGEYALDNLPFPNKEMAKARLRKKEAEQAAFMQNLLKQHPDVAEKVLEKRAGGGKH